MIYGLPILRCNPNPTTLLNENGDKMLIPNSLSDRGTELSSVGGIIDTFKAILGNPYDPDTNPDGFVNIGTAENVSNFHFFTAFLS